MNFIRCGFSIAQTYHIANGVKTHFQNLRCIILFSFILNIFISFTHKLFIHFCSQISSFKIYWIEKCQNWRSGNVVKSSRNSNTSFFFLPWMCMWMKNFRCKLLSICYAQVVPVDVIWAKFFCEYFAFYKQVSTWNISLVHLWICEQSKREKKMHDLSVPFSSNTLMHGINCIRFRQNSSRFAHFIRLVVRQLG